MRVRRRARPCCSRLLFKPVVDGTEPGTLCIALWTYIFQIVKLVLPAYGKDHGKLSSIQTLPITNCWKIK